MPVKRRGCTEMSMFKLDPVESLPNGTGKAPFWLFTREEMVTVDV